MHATACVEEAAKRTRIEQRVFPGCSAISAHTLCPFSSLQYIQNYILFVKSEVFMEVTMKSDLAFL
jgi:hypothetical protein